jgi:hypothetical protein
MQRQQVITFQTLFSIVGMIVQPGGQAQLEHQVKGSEAHFL